MATAYSEARDPAKTSQTCCSSAFELMRQPRIWQWRTKRAKAAPWVQAKCRSSSDLLGSGAIMAAKMALASSCGLNASGASTTKTVLLIGSAAEIFGRGN